MTTSRFNLVLVLALGLGTAALAQSAIPVPSGADVRHQETRFDEVTEPPSARFRYVQASLAADQDFDTTSADLLALCQSHALPNLGKNVSEVGQIIVSIADRETVFGETNPDVVQVFEIFAVKDEQCTWFEVFE